VGTISREILRHDCPDKDDKGDVGDDKQTNIHKGSKNKVRFVNALAIIPDDVF